MAEGAHRIVVGAEILWPLATDPIDFGQSYGWLESARHLFGDAILKVENLVERTVVLFRPDMRRRSGFDQLNGNSQPAAGALHTAFEDVLHAKFAANVAHIGMRSLVGEGGIAGDDEEGTDPAERGGQRLDDAVGEIILFGIVRHVVEGQNGDRRLVGEGEFLLFLPSRLCAIGAQGAWSPAPDTDRLIDILEVLFPHVLEDGLDLAPRMAAYVFGDEDAARLGHLFEARGDVHAIAVDVVTLDDDVAEIDADTQPYLAVFVRQGLLDCNRALDCIHD